MARTTIIKDKFAAWLALVPAVVTSAGGRVYPLGRAPQNVVRPYLTFQQSGSMRQKSLLGPTTRLMQVFLEVDIWGAPLIVSTIADAVRQAIDGDLPGKWIGIAGTLADAESEVTPTRIQYAEVINDHDKADPPQHGDEKPDTAVCLDIELWFEEG